MAMLIPPYDEVWINCPECKGADENCSLCSGTGEVETHSPRYKDWIYDHYACPNL